MFDQRGAPRPGPGSRSRNRRRLLLAVLLVAGCRSVSSETANLVAMTTVAAVTRSAISIAKGGCLAGCSPGTVCNGETALCEPLPCRGMCAIDEQCDESGPFPK